MLGYDKKKKNDVKHVIFVSIFSRWSENQSGQERLAYDFSHDAVINGTIHSVA